MRRGEILGIPTYIGSAVRDLLDRLSGLRRGAPRARPVQGRGYRPARHRRRACAWGSASCPATAPPRACSPSSASRTIFCCRALARFTRLGIIDRRAARRAARALIESLDIRPADPRVPVERLSGGNRQKVAIAKWLLSGADVLIMDDPARGVDVGAKVELYRVIAGHAEKGGAVVLASSDLDELLALSDRLVVLRGEAVIAKFPERPFGKADIVRTLATRPATARDGRSRIMKLAGKCALVTGRHARHRQGAGREAGRRGRECGVQLYRRAASAPPRSRLRSRAAHGRVFAMRSDVRDRAEVDAFVARAAAEFGRIDIAVNNAHQAYEGRAFAEAGWEDFQREIDTLVKGPFNVTQACLPHMRAQGGGAIVNIGSTMALAPRVRHAFYVTAKCALMGMTQSMALELGRYGIRVNMVTPGPLGDGPQRQLSGRGDAAFERRDPAARPHRHGRGSRRRDRTPVPG